jgi:hypothetical protein
MTTCLRLFSSQNVERFQKEDSLVGTGERTILGKTRVEIDIFHYGRLLRQITEQIRSRIEQLIL